VLQSEANMATAAEVTSYESRCYANEEMSAFRRLGCARLSPASTPLGPAARGVSDDVSLHHSELRPRQHCNELLRDDGEVATEDCTPQYTTQTDYRVANVSVRFPCPSFAAELVRKLRAMQRSHRQSVVATNTSVSLAPHPSWLDNGDRRTSFDFLPDSALSRVFASGLDSCELCRCGLVCRRWNAVVWNDVRLWTRIDLGGREALDVDHALRTLTRALSRTTPRLCVGVETVLLRDCRRLTDDGLRAVARRCPDLRRLDISSCTLVTDTAVFDVVSRCVNLQHLDVTGRCKCSIR